MSSWVLWANLATFSPWGRLQNILAADKENISCWDIFPWFCSSHSCAKLTIPELQHCPTVSDLAAAAIFWLTPAPLVAPPATAVQTRQTPHEGPVFVALQQFGAEAKQALREPGRHRWIRHESATILLTHTCGAENTPWDASAALRRGGTGHD